ncbi:NAD(P)H-dependent oxidoreductase [Yokenella regensburgei]|uniref:NAD(P)H-dependent oxidoreductase n=1 Tax=Yokenella regensburgei TaxID=158877 RepID=UPI003F175814
MHALIVVSHPDKDALTHHVAAAVAKGITASAQHTADIVDLTAEGFNPTFTAQDFAAFKLSGSLPAEIVAEQARIDKADALVLVFPVYWWSMPALLKGWIDRVFTHGWAYEETAEGEVVKKLGHLPVHIIGLGAASQGAYDRHGYTAAFNAQIAHGIFDYCGAQVKASELLLLPELGSGEGYLDKGRTLGERVFG